MELLEQFELFLLDKGLEDSTVYSTKKVMRRVIGNCTPLSGTNFSTFTTQLIRAKKSKSYILKFYYAIHYWGEFIKNDEFQNYPIPKLRNKTTFIRSPMSPDEIETFINLPFPGTLHGRFKEQWYKWTEFWRIQAWTGARPAEVSRLTINDVDFGTGVFRIRKTKTGIPREVPINEAPWKNIEKYVNSLQGNGNTLLFSRFSHPDKPVGMYGWIENFNRRKELMNLRRDGVVPYSLRHSLPTRLVKTNSIKDIMEIMGHKKLSTTERYLHTDLDSMRETINNDPMGAMHKNGKDQLQDILKIQRKIEEKYKKVFTLITPSEDGKELTVKFKVREEHQQ